MNFYRRIFSKLPNRDFVKRKFGADHHGHGHGSHSTEYGGIHLHVPQFYDNLGKGCLIVTYLWIMYRFKEDGAQLFGFYKPWLHPHEHVHYHFVETDVDTMPVLNGEDEHDDEEHEEDEE
jgi:hypothetical protein